MGIYSLPVELLKMVLMKTFIKQFTDHYKSHYYSCKHEGVVAAYTTLCVFCQPSSLKISRTIRRRVDCK